MARFTCTINIGRNRRRRGGRTGNRRPTVDHPTHSNYSHRRFAGSYHRTGNGRVDRGELRSASARQYWIVNRYCSGASRRRSARLPTRLRRPRSTTRYQPVPSVVGWWKTLGTADPGSSQGHGKHPSAGWGCLCDSNARHLENMKVKWAEIRGGQRADNDPLWLSGRRLCFARSPLSQPFCFVRSGLPEQLLQIETNVLTIKTQQARTKKHLQLLFS